MPKSRDFIEYFEMPGDYCCVHQIWGDPDNGGFMSVTTLRNDRHCNSYCWRCRLKTIWQALRYGPVGGDLEFAQRTDVDLFIAKLQAARDRVWPPAPEA